MHLEYEKYIQRKFGNSELVYMGKNYRLHGYVKEYDTHFKVLKDSFGYNTKEPL